MPFAFSLAVAPVDGAPGHGVDDCRRGCERLAGAVGQAGAAPAERLTDRSALPAGDLPAAAAARIVVGNGRSRCHGSAQPDLHTRTGMGTTALGTGERVRKSALRIEVTNGTVDEANAAIGIVRLHTAESPELATLDRMLATIQNDLFDLRGRSVRPSAAWRRGRRRCASSPARSEPAGTPDRCGAQCRACAAALSASCCPAVIRRRKPIMHLART